MTAADSEAAGAAPDPSFVRRALELADPDAVRLALYQQTRDPAIRALPVAAERDDAGRALLLDRASAWLLEHAGPRELEEPPEHELRELVGMATGEDVGDLEFEARRDLPAFRRFPLAATWSGERPTLPDGFRVVVVGSGFAGIAMGVQLEQLGIPYTVIERRADVGGTWSRHRYPDIRVDTSSVTYELPFEKNYPWSEYFGRGPEVRAYLEHVSRKYGVHRNTRFETTLERAEFDASRDRWQLTTSTPHGSETLEANVLVSGTGLFANPKQVRFPDHERFRGRTIHPSHWPDDLDLRGRRVGIVGNGSTGVQMLSPIAREAAQVFVFQRTPQWISPREKYGQPVEPEIRWLNDHFPGYWNWARFLSMSALFETHDLLLMDEQWREQGGAINAGNDQLRAFLTDYIETETGGRRDLIERLVPDYAPFSRRPVVDNGWYRALTRENVELVTDPIQKLTETGVATADGRVRELDVLITATGFEVVSFLAPARFIGAGGVDLHERWETGDGPRAYLGMMVPDFPNFFMIYGPNSQPVSGGTSLPIWHVLWAAYAGQCLVRMLEQGKTRVAVRDEAHTRYNEALDREAQRLVQMSSEGGFDRNYYVNQEHARLQANAPWYGPAFHRMCARPDWNDLDLT